MAHPSRVDFIPYLKEKLGDVPIAWDEKNNIWDTCRRAWLLFDPKADYHFVIQDDAIIGKDFKKNLEKLVDGSDQVYNLYIGRPRFVAEVRNAQKKGLDHLLKTNIHHEIALGFPTKRVKEMVEFVDKRNEKEEVQHDRFINTYVTAKKLKVYFPMPSLIDHRNHGSLHKLSRGNYVAKATWFIGT